MELKIVLLLALHISKVMSFVQPVYDPKNHYIEEADLNIGVVLSIRSSQQGKVCATVHDPLPVQFVEAVVFALERINSNPDILKDFKLGYVILDDCYSPTIALARAMQFMPSKYRSENSCQPWSVECNRDADLFHNVVGVMGAFSSELSIVIANVLSLFKIPQISHTATSDELSDKSKFPYFLRMVPPDKFQVQSTISVLNYFNWTHICIVYSKGSYGRESAKKLTRYLRDQHVCISLSIEITSDLLKVDYERIFEQLQDQTAKVIILYLDNNHIIPFTRVACALGIQEKFIWIGSDVFSLHMDSEIDTCEEFSGALSIRPYSANVPAFQKYLSHHSESSESDIPWQFTGGTPRILANLHLPDEIMKLSMTYRHVGTNTDEPNYYGASLAMDAIYAFALSLDRYIKINCRYTDRNNIVGCIKGDEYLKYIQNISFDGFTGKVFFDRNGDVVSRYEILQCQPGKAGSVQIPIGFWDIATEQLEIEDSKLIWGVADNPFNNTPQSSCGGRCGKGQVYYFPKGSCCWRCLECKPNEIVVQNETQCVVCDKYTWPNETNRTECVIIDPVYIGYSDSAAILLCTMSGLGLSLTLIVTLIFGCFQNERVVKSSSRELSYFMLVSMAAAYILVLLSFVPPGNHICHVNFIGFNLTLTLIYAPLLTKTNRIYRIFTAGRKSIVIPKFTSSHSQILLAGLLILPQVIIVTITAALVPPTVRISMPVRTERLVELFCFFPMEGLVSSSSYNLILVTICAIYAFKARKLPDNYNESRYISYCVDTTLLIWITFIPSYFVTSRSYHKIIIAATALLLNATVTLICLFIPKLYGLYETKCLKTKTTSGQWFTSDDTSRIRRSITPGELKSKSLSNIGFPVESDQDSNNVLIATRRKHSRSANAVLTKSVDDDDQITDVSNVPTTEL